MVRAPMIWEGKPLMRYGKPAGSDSCCCGNPCVCPTEDLCSEDYSVSLAPRSGDANSSQGDWCNYDAGTTDWMFFAGAHDWPSYPDPVDLTSYMISGSLYCTVDGEGNPIWKIYMETDEGDLWVDGENYGNFRAERSWTKDCNSLGLPKSISSNEYDLLTLNSVEVGPGDLPTGFPLTFTITDNT